MYMGKKTYTEKEIKGKIKIHGYKIYATKELNNYHLDLTIPKNQLPKSFHKIMGGKWVLKKPKNPNDDEWAICLKTIMSK